MKNAVRFIALAVLGFFSIDVALTPIAHADELNWTWNNGGDKVTWQDCNNWNPATTPGPANPDDNVNIAIGSYDTTMDIAGLKIRDLTFTAGQGNKTLTLTEDLTTSFINRTKFVGSDYYNVGWDFIDIDKSAGAVSHDINLNGHSLTIEPANTAHNPSVGYCDVSIFNGNITGQGSIIINNADSATANRVVYFERLGNQPPMQIDADIKVQTDYLMLSNTKITGDVTQTGGSISNGHRPGMLSTIIGKVTLSGGQFCNGDYGHGKIVGDVTLNDGYFHNGFKGTGDITGNVTLNGSGKFYNGNDNGSTGTVTGDITLNDDGEFNNGYNADSTGNITGNIALNAGSDFYNGRNGTGKINGNITLDGGGLVNGDMSGSTGNIIGNITQNSGAVFAGFNTGSISNITGNITLKNGSFFNGDLGTSYITGNIMQYDGKFVNGHIGASVGNITGNITQNAGEFYNGYEGTGTIKGNVTVHDGDFYNGYNSD